MTSTSTPTAPSASDTVWISTLAAFVALRVMIPLAVLAAAPARIPWLQAYTYVPLTGDSAAVLPGCCQPARGERRGAWRLDRHRRSRDDASVRRCVRHPLALRYPLVGSAADRAGACARLGVLVNAMASPSAPVIGWPIAWAVLLLPLHLLHIGITPDRAFPFALGLSLIANATIVVATASIGLRATGRRSVGLIAAGLYATWPIWVGLVAGDQASQNGQWIVDVGLALYDEPLSTALVAAALVLLLQSRLSATSAAIAGLMLGFATAVKLTNGPLAAGLVVVVALGVGIRRAAVLALAGMVSLPIVLGFWPKGYADASGGEGIDLGALYQLRFISPNVRESTIFTTWMLLLLLPAAALGCAKVTSWYRRALLIVPIVITIGCYASYYVTNQHPRFYYVILPAIFVLQASGFVLIWDAGRRWFAKRSRLVPSRS